MTSSAPLAGRPAISTTRKDGRSQRGALANNLRANAADRVKAVHGRTMICRAHAVKVLPKPTQNTGKNSIARQVKLRLTILLTFSDSAPGWVRRLQIYGCFRMPKVAVSFAALLCLGLVNSAQAERRMFLVANDADGYGVDRCLASGEKCGAAAAKAYCMTQDFAEASTYHKVDRNDMTGTSSSGVSEGCRGSSCNIVAIVCTR